MAEKGLMEIAKGVREDLDRTYQFVDSRSKIYVFDPGNPPSEMTTTLKKMRVPKKYLAEELKVYNDGELHATCFSTDDEFDYDYVIIFNSENPPKDEFAIIIGEETMHGEHVTRHKKGGYYPSLFSGIAREFIGGSGHYQIARKLDRDTYGKYYSDIDHAVGYELAKEAVSGEPLWKRKMFHETKEKRVWKLYNESVIPNIKIPITSKMLDKKEQALHKLDKYLKLLGLRRFNLDFVIYDIETGDIENPE